MEITIGLFIVLIILAFVCEFIDSSLGMGYGTILSPILIIMGFNPLISVPAILLSQAFGGGAATIFHHQFKNATFHATSEELKSVLVITSFGILATVFAAVTAIHIPKVMLKTYIGLLVTVMGIIVLMNRRMVFSWKKLAFIGGLSAFNKGLSGGGFGPVVTAGQILVGQKHKKAIGVTTLAEVPICLTAFLTYLIVRTSSEGNAPVWGMPAREFFRTVFSPQMFQWELLLALIIGSVLVAPFGAYATMRLNEKKIHLILGTLITVLGVWVLWRTWG